MSQSSTATKFRVFDKHPEPFGNSAIFQRVSKADKVGHLVSRLKNYAENHCTQVLKGTKFAEKTIPSHNGFVHTVVDAYNHHHNLVIRPDDLWGAIMTQFSLLMNSFPDDLRKEIVNFDKGKELLVAVPAKPVDASYDLFARLLTEKIHENFVDEEVEDWIMPNFSTTTKDDWISCGMTFMADTKKNCDTNFSCKCGIPWITLEGELKDYQDILERIEKLKIYDAENWFHMLEPIIMQFCKAKQEQIDLEFWQNMCLYEHSKGSGPSFISGWIAAFCVYDYEGKWQGNRFRKGGYTPWPQIDCRSIPSGFVEVEVRIYEGGCKEKHCSVIFAGHVAFEVLADKCTLKPLIGWAIALKLSAEDIAKIDEEWHKKIAKELAERDEEIAKEKGRKDEAIAKANAEKEKKNAGKTNVDDSRSKFFTNFFSELAQRRK